MSGNREHADTIRDYFDRAFEKDDEENRACFAVLDALVAEKQELYEANQMLTGRVVELVAEVEQLRASLERVAWVSPFNSDEYKIAREALRVVRG